MKLTRGRQGPGIYRYGHALPDGIHPAVVLDAKESVSRNGNEMLVITFGVRGPTGGTRIDHHVVSYHAEFVEEILRVLAPELLDDWFYSDACELDVVILKDRRCQVQVENEPWNGQERPRLRALLPLDTANAPPRP